MYDKVKDVQINTLQQRTLHPPIEEALQKLPGSADSILRESDSCVCSSLIQT